MDPVLALVIIVALICVTVVTVVLTKSKGGVVLSIKLGRRNVPESQALKPQATEVQPPAPALEEISFKQALETDALATGLEELGRRQVEYALGLTSAGAIVQSVALADQHDKLVISYERNATALSPQHANGVPSAPAFGVLGWNRERAADPAKSGEPLAGEAVVPLDWQSGKFLPMLKDARTGGFIEFAKGSPLKGSNRANTANAAALLTGVAQLASGMKVLHGLKEIDRRLSTLAEGRSIDQLAEIETIYNRISEIFSRPDWKERRSDLVASRDQLFKLRATWRRELEQVLESAPETPDTQAAEGFAKAGGIFFPPAFFVGKTLEIQREAEEEKLFGHLANAADLLQRIRLSMLLDISVSQALGEAETLAGVAMRNELEMWDGIVEKFKSKRKGIRTFETPADLQTVEDGMQGYVDMLSSVSTMKIQKSAAGHAERKPWPQASSSEPPVGSPDALAGHAGEISRILAAKPDKQSPERLLKEGAIAGKLLGSGEHSSEG